MSNAAAVALTSGMSAMTRQTTGPLPDYRLSASARTAREVQGTMLEQMDVDPPYQRGDVWTLDQRIALIKSFVMGVPIPAIILNDRATNAWQKANGEDVYDRPDGKLWACVDGKQRIETARQWFQGELAVPASWFPPSLVEQVMETRDGPYVTYLDLFIAERRHQGHSWLLGVIDAKLPTVQAEAELYVLINGGGTAQTPEDMANAARVARKGM